MNKDRQIDAFLNELTRDIPYKSLSKGIEILQGVNALQSKAGEVLSDIVKSVNINASIEITLNNIEYEKVALFYILTLARELTKDNDKKLYEILDCIDILERGYNFEFEIRYKSELVADYFNLWTGAEDEDADELCDGLHDTLLELVVNIINESSSGADDLIWDIIPAVAEDINYL